ncbi:MAG TPA: RodZ domain-containing protein [Rhodanobacter sp.]|nr:RodZ domain-containing protein [Rhodanobacter sp.]
MTSIQPNAPDRSSSEPDLFGIHPENMGSFESDAPGFGSRLRAAREARGLNLEACATALKLPARVLRQLEEDRFEGSDSKVYLASYIAKYGRYLGIDEASVEVELARLRQAEPVLVATGGISHSRFLFDRYATAATYVVLTLVIAVPTIWFGVRSTLDRDLSHLAPLDAAPVSQVDTTAHPGAAIPTARVDHSAAASSAAAQSRDQPLMASMAPFPNLADDSLTPNKPAVPVVANDHDGHTLQLTLSEASWVEVTQADGTRLEYGLLPAGSSKTYRSNQPLDINIGNVGGAQVDIDGQAVGLDDFRHANVAHFRMQLQNGKASAASL